MGRQEQHGRNETEALGWLLHAAQEDAVMRRWLVRLAALDDARRDVEVATTAARMRRAGEGEDLVRAVEMLRDGRIAEAAVRALGTP